MIPPAQINHAACNFETKGMTVFLWGHPGTWKTTWACQWPGVVFLSVASEGGDDALRTYPDIANSLMAANKLECPPVFNTAQPPKFDIHKCSQVEEYVELIIKNKHVWGVCTVVLDGICYLIDLWIDEYMRHKETDAKYRQQKEGRGGGDLMDPQAWGFLNMYLRGIRVRLQNAGLNVIWTTLQSDQYRTDPNNPAAEPDLKASIPMIQGKNRVTLPGACKLHIHADKTKVQMETSAMRQVTRPIFWTAGNSEVDLRHKYGFRFPQGKLQDPEFGDLPTFRAVWAELHEFIYVGQ